MSRETQYVGLTRKAEDFINKYALTKKEIKYACEKCSHIEYFDTLNITKVGSITGMFDEDVEDLVQYTHKETGRKFETFIQCERWSGGPVIATALIWSDTKEVIKESLWNEIEESDHEIVDKETGIYYV